MKRQEFNRFVFVTPMFNPSATLAQTLASLCGQSYDNWCVFLIDDVSSAVENQACEDIIGSFRNLLKSTGRDPGKIRCIWNLNKQWEMANVLKGISQCLDDDIICRLDADDWLTDLDCLAYLDAVYNETKADALWTAHRWGYTDRNISGPMSPGVDVYAHPWVSSHLKTFRKSLINGVPYENFTNQDGDLVRRAGDQALYLPVLHKAKRRGFVPRVYYHYTIDDVPETYQTQDAHFQRDEAIYLRRRGYISTGESWEAKALTT